MVLETPRLILREFEREDWTATYEYEKDPEVARYQSFDVLTAAESRVYVEKCIADQQSGNRRTFDLALIERSTEALIGRIGLNITRPEWGEGLLWYLLRRDRWSQGYMTEAVGAMLHFGFSYLELRRIIADTDPANIGSIRVLEKCGFRREGHHLQSKFIKGRWVDTFEFALLRSECKFFSRPQGQASRREREV